MKPEASAASFRRVDSPLGRVLLVAARGRLTGLYFEGQRDEPDLGLAPGEDRQAHAEDATVLDRASGQLREYFDGRRRRFDLPLELVGTPFQREVWQALLAIPFGATSTYGEIAARIGRPRAVRAVGGAIGRNPVSIVVPCHRIVGSDGSLTGFGGGLPRKRALLGIEGAMPSSLL
ncbi:methylated-DNA--[protein]-cysteine S-methyltransferase [Burkholderiaceae bacterium FT117]|uniref:methylated-DNA--[protein]-cysteine S-methyltransferase n=1 Tax=Zeimonas sediminis TaxID=2944268 RepID=UPI002342F093|nr:methylated-DNA--[protein]-cysteine S-methyltransferase [Zeimonas sediminis]MCM5572318.1 methylated-DNA--[protein]-cysteine S-methyltransferase [Zeimonas sediminis]